MNSEIKHSTASQHHQNNLPTDQVVDSQSASDHSCCSTVSASAQVAPKNLTDLSAPTLKDPVCGMTVSTKSAHTLQRNAEPIYFCSASCKTKFAANPEQYLTNTSAEVEAESAIQKPPGSALYICPMHPEICQDHPGSCSICGMALEPEMPTLDEVENPELLDFTRRFIWTLPLTIVVTALAMVGHRLQLFEMATQSWIESDPSPQIILKNQKDKRSS